MKLAINDSDRNDSCQPSMKVLQETRPSLDISKTAAGSPDQMETIASDLSSGSDGSKQVLLEIESRFHSRSHEQMIRLAETFSQRLGIPVNFNPQSLAFEFQSHEPEQTHSQLEEWLPQVLDSKSKDSHLRVYHTSSDKGSELELCHFGDLGFDRDIPKDTACWIARSRVEEVSTTETSIDSHQSRLHIVVAPTIQPQQQRQPHEISPVPGQTLELIDEQQTISSLTYIHDHFVRLLRELEDSGLEIDPQFRVSFGHVVFFPSTHDRHHDGSNLSPNELKGTRLLFYRPFPQITTINLLEQALGIHQSMNTLFIPTSTFYGELNQALATEQSIEFLFSYEPAKDLPFHWSPTMATRRLLMTVNFSNDLGMIPRVRYELSPNTYSGIHQMDMIHLDSNYAPDIRFQLDCLAIINIPEPIVQFVRSAQLDPYKHTHAPSSFVLKPDETHSAHLPAGTYSLVRPRLVKTSSFHQLDDQTLLSVSRISDSTSRRSRPVYDLVPLINVERGDSHRPSPFFRWTSSDFESFWPNLIFHTRHLLPLFMPC
jgi:hypothetical protein